MDPRAIEEAEKRLKRADKAVQQLQVVTSFEDVDEAWSAFLGEFVAIYNKLFEGAKSSGKSSGWFGRKVKERKSDQLLNYLYHARNSDEHGIEAIAVETGTTLHIGKVGESFTFNMVNGKIHIASHTQQPVSVWSDPFISLVTVNDTRFRDSFHPPVSHNGFYFKKRWRTPRWASKFGYDALVKLVKEAWTLAR